LGITVRPATEDDFEALASMDLTYPTNRYLRIERSGAAPEHTIEMRWHERPTSDTVYNEYPAEGLRQAQSKLDLFLVAESDGFAVGLLMIIVPSWTNAAEITDFAVDRAARRRGAGRALLEAATAWAREHRHIALWVEPRADNGDAIEFYLKNGFRISGFNDHLYSNSDDEPGQQTLYLHLEL
jgi:ribosomal protein S18 acetylase RimI-like enzyme